MILKWKSIKSSDTYVITNFCTKIEWSGADTQASRTVEFDLVNSPHDPEIKRPHILLGDIITLTTDDGKVRFIGRVTSYEKSSEVGTVTITAKDYMHNMINSKASYKFKNKTPEYITRAVCKDIGITVGKLATTKKKIAKYLPSDMSYYDIIIKAYQMVSGKTKKLYMPVMDGTNFTIIQKGKIIKDFALKDDVDIYKSSVTKNIDSMVNKVVVYNKKNQKIGTLTQKNWVKNYGYYQTTESADNKKEKVNYYTKKGKKKTKSKSVAAKSLSASMQAKAKKDLKGPEQSATLDCVGHIGCVSGRGIRVIDHLTGLTSTYWIKSDKHTWENGHHTMELELSFKNSMENVQYNKYQAQKNNSSSSSGGSEGGDGSYYYVSTGHKYPAVFTSYGTYYHNPTHKSWTKGSFGKNYAYKTVAGPLCFGGKYVKIEGTGTKWDGKVVHVSDSGKGADGKYFHKENGRWHFDVCEKTWNEAAAFGRHNGTVTVMKKKHRASGYTGGKFAWPCHGKIMANVGVRRKWDPYDKGPSHHNPYGGHEGMDIAVSFGTEIHAAAAGTVTLAGRYGGYGNCVIINHGGGLTTLYGHNSSLCCHRGQHVKKNQVIAKAGSTGFSSGVHCHFQVELHGIVRKPLSYLK